MTECTVEEFLAAQSHIIVKKFLVKSSLNEHGTLGVDETFESCQAAGAYCIIFSQYPLSHVCVYT